MSASKKSSKKANNIKNDKRRIYYVFSLLFLANLIVIGFFSYFIFRIANTSQEYSSAQRIIVNKIPKVIEPVDLETSALSYIVYDPLTRTVVLSKNPNLRMSPASSIKILTALVALDVYDLNHNLSAIPAGFDESKMGLYSGEVISVESLLYGLLLNSGNDAAKTIAYNFPNGYNAFVIAMNRKAKELGLNESYFVDPSGYMDSNYSTAFQMALLAAHAMKDETIREIVRTRIKTVYDSTGLTAHRLTNLNELLSDTRVNGIKTGFTNEAGGVLITGYNHNGRELIIVVMKSQDRFSDTRKIINEVVEKVVYSDAISAELVAN